MGAEPYSYVVPYDADPQRALDRLRSEVFASGRYFGASKRPATPERALELAGESGTRSILDIETVADEPDFRRAAPLTNAELDEYFGTRRQTAEMAENSDELWENLERGMARFFVAYEEDAPTHVVFVGYSFD